MRSCEAETVGGRGSGGDRRYHRSLSHIRDDQGLDPFYYWQRHLMITTA